DPAAATATPDTTPNTATTPDTSVTPQATVPATTPDPASGAVADATPQTTVVAPKDFMQQAFLANEFGIAASQMALQQAKNSEVKDAAQAVLNDGLKVRADMVATIQNASSDMHFDQNWSDDYKQKLADLKSAKGDDFDQKYLATQGEITNQSTDLYSNFASTGSDQAPAGRRRQAGGGVAGRTIDPRRRCRGREALGRQPRLRNAVLAHEKKAPE
ncbi:MAG: DUF4142 domain-containing protein, partial [Asticcacaulis sp.]|nr:DUF4142 domain-containing protein [Asticcacaulis sp.]